MRNKRDNIRGGINGKNKARTSGERDPIITRGKNPVEILAAIKNEGAVF